MPPAHSSCTCAFRAMSPDAAVDRLDAEASCSLSLPSMPSQESTSHNSIIVSSCRRQATSVRAARRMNSRPDSGSRNEQNQPARTPLSPTVLAPSHFSCAGGTGTEEKLLRRLRLISKPRLDSSSHLRRVAGPSPRLPFLPFLTCPCFASHGSRLSLLLLSNGAQVVHAVLHDLRQSKGQMRATSRPGSVRKVGRTDMHASIV